MGSRLYRPRSMMECVEGHRNVEVIWIPLRAERIRLAPYPVLIKSFEDLSPGERSLAKGYVDEFFTLNELNILKVYLEEQRSIFVREESFSLPIDCRDDRGGVRMPLRCLSEDAGWSIFHLDERGKMDLPFDMAGYFSSQQAGY